MAGTMAQILKAFGEAMKRRRVVKRRTYRRKARGDGEEADGMLAGRKRRVVKRRTYRRKARGDGELSIIDFKTSKRPKAREDIISYFIQEAM